MKLRELLDELAPTGIFRDPIDVLFILESFADGARSVSPSVVEALGSLTDSDLVVVEEHLSDLLGQAPAAIGVVQEQHELAVKRLRRALLGARTLSGVVPPRLIGLLESALAEVPIPEARPAQDFGGSYVARLQARFGVADATWQHSPWDPDVALGDRPEPGVRPAIRVLLPHLDAAAEGFAHVDGLLWRLPWSDGPRPHRFGETLSWGDEVTGVLHTLLRPMIPSRVWLAAHAMRSATRLADPAPLAAREQRAVLLSKALAEPPLCDALRELGRAFREGTDPAEGLPEAVANLVRARLLLSEAAHALDEPDALLAALAASDQRLEDVGDAVIYLDDGSYEDAIEDLRTVSGSWTAARQALDNAGSLDDLVEDPLVLLTASWIQRSDGPGATAARTEAWPSIAPHRADIGAPLLARGLQRAPITEHAPGAVPLLLVTSGGTGLMVTLVVRHEAGAALWGDDVQLGRRARGAVRAAFAAARRLCPHKLPRYPLADHAIEFEPAGVIDAIDGDSLGLPLALAFASLWTGQTLPEGVAATGSITDGGRVGCVDDVEQKVGALLAKVEHATLLVHPGVAATFPAALTVRHCDTLTTALAHVDISLLIQTWPNVHGNQTRRRQALKALVSRAELQALPSEDPTGLEEPGIAALSPWLQLADRMRELIESLPESAPLRSELWKARTQAALAYLHAGAQHDALGVLGIENPRDSDRLHQVLERLETEEVAPAIRADVVMALLDVGIDEGRTAEGAVLRKQLTALWAQMSGAEAAALGGRILGTQGRSLLHGGDAAESLPLLASAVEHHVVHEPHEAPRSRIYLAMALRRIGRREEALRTLEQAERELAPEAWDIDASYRVGTRMYWDYERARLALDRAELNDAWRYGLDAYREARWRGSWPRAGVLRTLAWAARAARLPAEEERALRELQEIAESSGGDRFFETLLAEARGPYRRDGEVY